MLILYAALRHDYGKIERGDSFEHWAFFDSLRRMGHDILYFDFAGIAARRGREGMSRRLAEVVEAERPDLSFFVLFEEEFDKAVVRRISDSGATTTLNWFCDDHWRFDDFSRQWAPCFNWCVTTSGEAFSRYRRLGMTNVLKSQWGCNEALCRRLDLPRLYDVSFVGQAHGDRWRIVSSLRDCGLDVRCWGVGWPAGRLEPDRMVEVFNQSRVNLNFSAASCAARWGGPTVVTRALRRFLRAAKGQGGGSRWTTPLRRLLARRSEREIAGAAVSGAGAQIKARVFEVCGAGGFLLTGDADNLGDYYDLSREVWSFRDGRELLDAARRALADESGREERAETARLRTLRDLSLIHI